MNWVSVQQLTSSQVVFQSNKYSYANKYSYECTEYLLQKGVLYPLSSNPLNYCKLILAKVPMGCYKLPQLLSVLDRWAKQPAFFVA